MPAVRTKTESENEEMGKSRSDNVKKGGGWRWILPVVFVCWFCLYVYGLNENREGRQGASLIWETPVLSWSEVAAVREKETEGGDIQLYLWDEMEGQAKNPDMGIRVPVRVIYGIGDMEQTMGLHFVSGWYLPTDTERKNEGNFAGSGAVDDLCLVSSQVAQKLWKSTDVIGKELLLGERRLYVAGVTDGENPEVFVREQNQGAKKRHLEIVVGEKAAAAEVAFTQKEMAGAFIGRHGFTTPDTVQDNGWIAGIKMTMLRLPVLAGGLIIFVVWRKKREKGLCKVIGILFFSAFYVSLLFWTFQDMVIPGDMIPPAWSDFDFWSEKLKNTCQFDRILYNKIKKI